MAAIARNTIAPGGRATVPRYLVHAIEQYAAASRVRPSDPQSNERFGRFWERTQGPGQAERDRHARLLRSCAQGLRSEYIEGQSPGYCGLQPLAYALYYLPLNFVKPQLALLDLLGTGRLPQDLHVVDVGTGVGTVPLAVADLVAVLGQVASLLRVPPPIRSLRLTCLEASRENLVAFAEVRRYLPEGILPPEHVTTRQVRLGGDTDLTGMVPGDANVAVFANVLNEMASDERVQVVDAIASRIQPGAPVVIIEPADRGKSTDASRLWRDLRSRGHELIEPSPDACRRCSGVGDDGCWCFRTGTLSVPGFMIPLGLHPDTGLAGGEPGTAAGPVDDTKWSIGVLANGRSTGSYSEPRTQDGYTSLAAEVERLRHRTVPDLLSGKLRLSIVSSPMFAAGWLKVCDGSDAPWALSWDDGSCAVPLDYGDAITIKGGRLYRNRSSSWPEIEHFIGVGRDTVVEPHTSEIHLPPLDRRGLADGSDGALRYLAARALGEVDEMVADLPLRQWWRFLVEGDASGVDPEHPGHRAAAAAVALLLPGLQVIEVAQESPAHTGERRCEWPSVDGAVLSLRRLQRVTCPALSSAKLLYATRSDLQRPLVKQALQRLATVRRVQLHAAANCSVPPTHAVPAASFDRLGDRAEAPRPAGARPPLPRHSPVASPPEPPRGQPGLLGRLLRALGLRD